MKAIVKTKNSNRSLELQNVNLPTIQDDEILIKIVNVAICGTDLHIYEYTKGYEFIKTPLTIGHEFSGYVEKVGSSVTGFAIGDRVIGESNRYCGQCTNCKLGKTEVCLNSKMTGLHINGAMAEYIAVPANIVHHLPENLSFIEGAIAQPISVSLNAVFRNCEIQPGDNVIVFGPGIQGIMAAQAARLKGASRVAVIGTDQDQQSRLPIAEELGFLAINSSNKNIRDEIKHHWGTETVDVILDASGAVNAVREGISLLKRGGIATIFGIYAKSLELDLTYMVRNQIRIFTSYTSTWTDYDQALKLLASGQLDVKKLISEYDFQDFEKAFEEGLSKASIKPVLTINNL